MLNLERIFQQERLLRAITGLNLKAFDSLLPSFAEAYEQSRVNRKVERKRAIGGGRKAGCGLLPVGYMPMQGSNAIGP